MTQAQHYKYPLDLPQSLKEAAARMSQEDGVSLRWIVAAVAQKIGAVQTAQDFLRKRAGQSARGDLTRLLDKAPDVPPSPEDVV